MTIEADHKDLKFVSFEEAIKPKSGLAENFIDHWWVCHPEKGVAYYNGRGSMAPQCNSNESTARALCKRLYGDWAEVRQIPFVSRHINPQDYCY